MPILVDAVGNSIEDSLATVIGGEEAHRSGPSPHLAEFTLQQVGGADFLPKLFGERVVVEAVVEVLPHTPDCSLLIYLPLLLPGLESLCGPLSPYGWGQQRCL